MIGVRVRQFEIWWVIQDYVCICKSVLRTIKSPIPIPDVRCDLSTSKLDRKIWLPLQDLDKTLGYMHLLLIT